MLTCAFGYPAMTHACKGCCAHWIAIKLNAIQAEIVYTAQRRLRGAEYADELAAAVKVEIERIGVTV